MNYTSLTKAEKSMGFHSPSKCNKGLKPAFTLVELLVVITIVGILLTVGAMGLKNLSKASGVTAALPIAEGIFGEARGLSMGSGEKTRVLIHADPDNNEKYLRFMMVVSESESGQWVAASRGVYLPDGVYFSREYSHLDFESESGEFKGGSAMESIDIYSSEGGPINTNLSDDYFYYEFNSEGISASSEPSSFVVGTGNKPPGADSPRVGGNGGVSNFGGFVIWRKGTTSLFRHKDQMNIPDGIEGGDEF